MSPSTSTNYSLTLIEYLAESVGGDGVHYIEESSVMFISPIKYLDGPAMPLYRKAEESNGRTVHISTSLMCEKRGEACFSALF